MKIAILLFFFAALTGLQASVFGLLEGTVKDENGEALAGATAQLLGTKCGAFTDPDGSFRIVRVTAGRYDVKVTFVGKRAAVVKDVVVQADSTSRVDVVLVTDSIAAHEVALVAARSAEMSAVGYPGAKAATITGARVNAKRLRSAGRFYDDDVTAYSAEEYTVIDESGFNDVMQNPLSTFAADVDGASYSNVRRFINHGSLPPKDAIRVEEFINYFTYDYPRPDKRPLELLIEYSDCPWNNAHRLVHIGLQGKEFEAEGQPRSNLVFLLDVSGSMRASDKLPLLKEALRMLVERLLPGDRVAIVVYAGAAGLVLPSTAGSNKKAILSALAELRAGGSTAGGAGIELAYQTAQKHFISDGNNRVILATDGDFNVGVASTGELARLIETKREQGVYLSVLGFGMGNYKDSRLQELAKRGNGNHAYIDNLQEARKVFIHDLMGTLFTIAKDVKIQVEFNPAKISAYRLIGYQNRRLANRDFRDDAKDAGEVGAGHEVTALYEVVPAAADAAIAGAAADVDLLYQEVRVKPSAIAGDEVLVVRIRYKEPDSNSATEYLEVQEGGPVALARSSDNFRWAAAVAAFAMLLRDSAYLASADAALVSELAAGALGKDRFGYRKEFMTLLENARKLGLDNR